MTLMLDGVKTKKDRRNSGGMLRQKETKRRKGSKREKREIERNREK